MSKDLPTSHLHFRLVLGIKYVRRDGQVNKPEARFEVIHNTVRLAVLILTAQRAGPAELFHDVARQPSHPS